MNSTLSQGPSKKKNGAYMFSSLLHDRDATTLSSHECGKGDYMVNTIHGAW